jgi:spermidine synthase
VSRVAAEASRCGLDEAEAVSRVAARFEVLDVSPTPLGDVTLWRRLDPTTGGDVFEVKLGDEYLMSSRFTVAEVEVARLALAALPDGELDVVVGGLGLGYTAQTVLDDARVRSMVVVDALEAVIGWHERGLVPVSVSSSSDTRCRLVHGDFFAMSAGSGFDPDRPDRRFDAIVVDIDHSPRHLLNPSNSAFYTEPGVRRLSERLRPGGVFALWSNEPPDEDYLAVLRLAFRDVSCEVVRFDNPLQDREATNSVYVAR